MSSNHEPCMLLCPCCKAEVFGGVSLQHHHRGSEGFERYGGAHRGGGRRELHAVRVRERISHRQRLRDSSAGPEADQDGGEGEGHSLLRCFSSTVKEPTCPTALCSGLPHSWGCVRLRGDSGRPGALRPQHQQRHHGHRTGLPGGPGGYCSSTGSAVWAPGAFEISSHVEHVWQVGSWALKICFWFFKVSNIEARILALKTAGLNVASCNRFSQFRTKDKVGHVQRRFPTIIYIC